MTRQAHPRIVLTPAARLKRHDILDLPPRSAAEPAQRTVADRITEDIHGVVTIHLMVPVVAYTHLSTRATCRLADRSGGRPIHRVVEGTIGAGPSDPSSRVPATIVVRPCDLRTPGDDLYGTEGSVAVTWRLDGTAITGRRVFQADRVTGARPTPEAMKAAIREHFPTLDLTFRLAR